MVAALLCLAQGAHETVNIVQTFSSFTFRGHLCITFELLSLNLYEYIKSCNFQVGRGAHARGMLARKWCAAPRCCMRLASDQGRGMGGPRCPIMLPCTSCGSSCILGGGRMRVAAAGLVTPLCAFHPWRRGAACW